MGNKNYILFSNILTTIIQNYYFYFINKKAKLTVVKNAAQGTKEKGVSSSTIPPQGLNAVLALGDCAHGPDHLIPAPDPDQVRNKDQ